PQRLLRRERQTRSEPRSHCPGGGAADSDPGPSP
ncbi:MAG: hypothetical protein JWN77_756, partial [Frankiales bacterium]|nr:hypothetical protein [Frankiales bacterium]